jgi:hypothetical protein
MGSIDAIVSSNGGRLSSIPGAIVDHEQRHGAVQFAYSDAVFIKAPKQRNG